MKKNHFIIAATDIKTGTEIYGKVVMGKGLCLNRGPIISSVASDAERIENCYTQAEATRLIGGVALGFLAELTEDALMGGTKWAKDYRIIDARMFDPIPAKIAGHVVMKITGPDDYTTESEFLNSAGEWTAKPDEAKVFETKEAAAALCDGVTASAASICTAYSNAGFHAGLADLDECRAGKNSHGKTANPYGNPVKPRHAMQYSRDTAPNAWQSGYDAAFETNVDEQAAEARAMGLTAL